MMTLVLNGWAASREAWSLCDFIAREDTILLSYVDQLNGDADRALAREKEKEKCLLIGWSMGATEALRLACEQTEKIAALILLAATPRIMADTNWPGMREHRLKALEAGLKLTHGTGFFGPPKGLPNPYQMDDEKNLSRGLAFLATCDVRARLRATFNVSRAVPFPVYIFQSEKDGIVKSQNAAYLKEEIFPHASVEMIPGGEHALPIYIPEKINALVSRIQKKSAQERN